MAKCVYTNRKLYTHLFILIVDLFSSPRVIFESSGDVIRTLAREHQTRGICVPILVSSGLGDHQPPAIISFTMSADESETVLGFFYGTLKRGYPNYNHVPPSAEFVSCADTSDALPLVIGNSYGVPFLIDQPAYPGAAQVHGELFRMTIKERLAIDEFEGVGRGCYIVKPIQVHLLDSPSAAGKEQHANGTTVTAYAYFRDPSNSGPNWMRKCTIEYLLTQPMMAEYTMEQSTTYRSAIDRE